MDEWMDAWLAGWLAGWMDGWRRPNHIRSHFGALHTTTSVNFRRAPCDLHEVVKQASFNIASERDFPRFLKRFFGDLGGSSERQT